MAGRSKTSVGTILISAILMMAMAAAPAYCEEVYKIGGIFSVTGPASFLGDPEQKSLEMAVEQINAAGGIDGHQVEAVIYDTEGDPSKAVLAATKLINKDQVLAIIGPSLTPTSLAVIPIAERNEIPLVSCAAGVGITTPVKKWVFKTAQTDVMAVENIYRHMQKHGIKKVGIITVSNAYGESGKQQLEKQAADFGLTVVASETFGAKDTDMTAQLTKIRKESPDAIVCWGTNPGPAVVARNVKQLNIETPIYQSHGVASPKFLELAKEAADASILPTGRILVADLLPAEDPLKAGLESYIKDYEGKYNIPVSGFGGYAYDAMGMLAEALKGTGGDRAKIRDNLEKISDYRGVTGTFNITAEDHNGLGEDAFVTVVIKDGKWALVE